MSSAIPDPQPNNRVNKTVMDPGGKFTQPRTHLSRRRGAMIRFLKHANCLQRLSFVLKLLLVFASSERRNMESGESGKI